MRGLVVMTIALLLTGSALAQQPSKTAQASAKPSAFTMSVAISVDAPAEMRWTIVDRLTRRVKNTRNVAYVEKDPEWVITIVAFDPFPKEGDKKKKQYSMSTAFLQQMVWTDPALLESVRENPCVPAEKIGDYMKTQHKLGNLFTMGAYAGLMDEIPSTVDEIVDGFVTSVLEPAKKNYEIQGARAAQERWKQPMPLHQTERPKKWPHLPPKKP